MGTQSKNNFPLADALKEKNFLYHGAHLTLEVLKDIGVDSWPQRISLIHEIQASGFFVTKRGLPEGELRVLESREMAGHAYKKLAKATLMKTQTALVLATHKAEGLTEIEEAQFQSAKEAATRDAFASQKSLMENVDFGAIGMSPMLRKIRESTDSG